MKKKKSKRESFQVPVKNFRSAGVKPEVGKKILLKRINGDKVDTTVKRVVGSKVILEKDEVQN